MQKLAVLCAALAAAAVLAANAFAAEPAKSSFSFTATATLTGVCSFDVSVTANVRGTQIVYFNSDGSVNRVYIHQVEQDTFSANGKSISGEPYDANVQILFDSNGNLTHVYSSGVVEHLVLPSGTLFLSAGRLDFVNHPGVAFILSPDVGNPGDVAAFCAALS
jgi:hypothetical protein